MDVIIAPSIDDLPPGASALFPGVPFDRTSAWFRIAERDAIAPGARPFYLVVQDAGRPVAVWPMQEGPEGVRSLTNPYTCHYAPAGTAAGDAAGQAFRRWPLVRLEALDDECRFANGLRSAGLLVLPYAHFGNWHEAVSDWPDYLAARPGQLRETIRRRSRALGNGALVAEFATRPDEAGSALEAYQDVYGRSWKDPEPYPRFAAAYVQAAARAGVLRMGVLRHEGRPVAAQYWTFEAGVATVLKLAHDEAEKALSPGTVLTALMIRRAIEEGAREIDFGRGDDDYKQLWTSQRRQRMGWLVANPRRPAGALAAARHVAGVLRRRLATAG